MIWFIIREMCWTEVPLCSRLCRKHNGMYHKIKIINQLFHYTMQCYEHKYCYITKRSNQNFRLSKQIYVYKSVILKIITLSFGVHNLNQSPPFLIVSTGAALSQQKDDIDLNDDKM